MPSLSRRAILMTGVAALPALAVARPMAAFGSCLIPNFIPSTVPLRQVATGSHVPDSVYVGASFFTTRSPHFNRSGRTLTNLMIAVPDFYGAGLRSGQRTWTAKIEYPANNFTDVTWGGLPNVVGAGAPAPGTSATVPYMTSDLVQLTAAIPDNALFWVRLCQQSANTIIFQNIGNYQTTPLPRTINKALGETNCSEANPQLLGAPVIQDPLNGNRWAFSNGGTGLGVNEWATVRPLAILGESRKKAFSFWGDSRVCGIGDTFDGICDDRGEVERSIGPDFAYINFGVPGQQLAGLYKDDPDANKRGPFRKGFNDNPWLVFGQCTTNLIEDLGGADCVAQIDFNSTLALKQLLWNAWKSLGPDFTTASLSTLTFPPYTGNSVANPLLSQFSDILRSSPPMSGNDQVRVIDVASVVAQNCDANYSWKMAGYAADGLHESQAGCMAIHDSGVIDPYALTR